MGEIGLTGALRPVGHAARRLKSAADHQVARAITGPLGGDVPTPAPAAVLQAEELRDAIRGAFRPAGG